MSATQPIPDGNRAWDEARCTAALATLEKLQDQLDELRPIVPTIVAPFTSPQDSPEALSRDFKQTAIAEAKRMQTFERTWKSDNVQDIFGYATQSLKADPDLTKGASLPRYGWIDIVEKQQKPTKAGLAKAKKSRAKGGDAEDKFVATSIVPTVNAFKEAHPSFKVDVEEGRIITIMFQVPLMVLKFKVVPNIDSDNNATFDVECLGNMPLCSAISRCIASRPRPNHLPCLLEMIAAYTDARIAKCAKCGKLLDRAALSPAARRSKQSTSTDENQKTAWEPFHEGCL